MARNDVLRVRRKAMKVLPHEGHRALVLRKHRTEGIHDRDLALHRCRERSAERPHEWLRIDDARVVPHRSALAPPIGLVVTQHDRKWRVEHDETARVVREVVRRPEDDPVAPLFEPLAIEAHEREVFGELRRVHDADGAGAFAALISRLVLRERERHVDEARAELRVGIDRTRMRRQGERVQHHGLRLAGRRVAVELREGQPLVGDEDVGARDAVPQRLGREPHRFLVRREREELVEQVRMIRHHATELVVHGSDVFRGAVERAPELGVDEDRLFAKARRAVDPRIGEHASVDDTARERVVGVARAEAHARCAIDSAVAM